ncbi:MAG: hypothetical protein OXG35_02490 [Acidobacteria bacterium]|nr:hypothetical protein [Acidobacteriota bacterium]
MTKRLRDALAKQIEGSVAGTWSRGRSALELRGARFPTSITSMVDAPRGS